MPRKASLAYRRHKSKNLGYCRVDGRFVYFGPFDSPESHRRYRSFLAERAALAEGREFRPKAELSVGELAEQWLAWMVRERGPANSKSFSARSVAACLVMEHAGLPAREFGPKALSTIQRRLLAEGKLCRTGINRRVRDIVSVFKWGVSEELIAGPVWQALSTIRPLRYGVGKENAPRVAADPAAVDAVVALMEKRGATDAARVVRFLRATGCRPGEAFTMTPADLRLADDPPVYVVRNHKCEHHGMARVVVLNDAALAVVHEALAECRRMDAPLFLNRSGTPFDATMLRHSIQRACKAADVREFVAYSLRHLAATEAMNRTRSEASVAAMLGHSPNSKLVRRYSRDRLSLAAEAAKAVG